MIVSIYIKEHEYLNISEKIHTLKGIIMILSISSFIKEKRKQLKITQVELSERAGAGLRFIRELEQGKQTVRLDKVNQVLALFGTEVGVIKKVEE